MVERLFKRSISNHELVTLDLAREIFEVATDLKRKVGVIISRSGHIEEVFLGQKDLLYIPDLGRYRLGAGRLRRLRLIFSDLSKRSNEAHIPHDIYTDLEKLRFDAVVAVKSIGNTTSMAYAHLLPIKHGNGSEPNSKTELVKDLGRFDLDFTEFITELESDLEASMHVQSSSGKMRAFLVGVYEKGYHDSDSSIAELEELAKTAGVEVVGKIIQRRELDPRTLVGKGKLEEIVLKCLRLNAEMIIFDTELKPTQWRVITNSTELKVIDRAMLILDIFAKHAKSADGRVQVELAQLRYNMPKLVEKDAGLSRLTGGIGGQGPGETKLEIGRRRIRERINQLEKRIDELSKQRELRRKGRKERFLPQISILGYTNVGKSTLFNALSGSKVLVENKLFATLDPTERRIVLPYQPEDVSDYPRAVILTDTVGFIRRLPAELSNAFRATLEELHYADLLLHVLDASDPEVSARRSAVERILEELKLSTKPTLVILNKVDAVTPDHLRALVREHDAIPVSAKTSEGLDGLLWAIREKVVPKVEVQARNLSEI